MDVSATHPPVTVSDVSWSDRLDQNGVAGWPRHLGVRVVRVVQGIPFVSTMCEVEGFDFRMPKCRGTVLTSNFHFPLFLLS